MYLGKSEITAVYLGKKVVSAIYKGATLIWEAVRSCFGAGYWKNDAPWKNAEGWKN